MTLQWIRVCHHRNLVTQTVKFSGQSALFCGNNAQGKTNAMEAIYILGTGRSFRSSGPRHWLHQKEEQGQVEGETTHGERITVRYSASGRTLQWEGEDVGAGEFAGRLPVVAHQVGDRSLVAGPSRERRRLLDACVALADPTYLSTLARLRRALAQRNILLAKGEKGETFRVFTQALAKVGKEVQKRRMAVQPELEKNLEYWYHRLGFTEKPGVHYRPSVGPQGDLKDSMEKDTSREEKAGFSLWGPQRDDVRFTLDDQEVSRYASSGQQRSLAMACRVAQGSWAGSRREWPVLLLDDVDAELDRQRVGGALEELVGRTQVIASSTRDDVLKWMPGAHRFQVKEGKVESL